MQKTKANHHPSNRKPNNRQKLQSTSSRINPHPRQNRQHCRHPYTNTLKQHRIANSMTETNHLLEKQLPNRSMRFWKNNYTNTIAQQTGNIDKAKLCESISSKNNQRPHLSYDSPTPHKTLIWICIEIQKRWKNYYKNIVIYNLFLRRLASLH